MTAAPPPVSLATTDYEIAGAVIRATNPRMVDGLRVTLMRMSPDGEAVLYGPDRVVLDNERDRDRFARLARLDQPQRAGLIILYQRLAQAVTEAAAPPVAVNGTGITLAELQTIEFPPLRWVVAGLLPEGAALLAAKPKSRKSWLALAIGIAVAMGGRVLGTREVEKGGVLYLDLEGNQRRIQSRLRQMLTRDDRWPASMHLYTEWPRGEAGLALLRQWLLDHPDTRLVVIDVLQNFREQMEAKASVYDYDRETIGGINRLAEEFHITILLIHHTKKSREEDIFDEISGSTGITSALSTYWVLARAADGQTTTLHLRGRDLIDDEPLALRWDNDLCGFVVEGPAAALAGSVTRQAIMDFLADDQPHTLKEIAAELGKSTPAVSNLLKHLVSDNRVDKVGYGSYARVIRPSDVPASVPPGTEVVTWE